MRKRQCCHLLILLLKISAWERKRNAAARSFGSLYSFGRFSSTHSIALSRSSSISSNACSAISAFVVLNTFTSAFGMLSILFLYESSSNASFVRLVPTVSDWRSLIAARQSPPARCAMPERLDLSYLIPSFSQIFFRILRIDSWSSSPNSTSLHFERNEPYFGSHGLFAVRMIGKGDSFITCTMAETPPRSLFPERL